MKVIIILPWVASFFTGITLIPQSYKIIKTRDTTAISLWMFIIFLISGILWVYYGIVTSQIAIIVTNSLITIFSISIATYKIFNIKKKGENY